MKHATAAVTAGEYIVAPHVGAWIETVAEVVLNSTTVSPPTWGRGLKPKRGQ
mgnify:CR=1 FL=1